MTTSNLKPAQHPQQIQPTPTEEIFFGHLNDFVKEGRLQVEPEIPATECRIAGGWVRDKVSSFTCCPTSSDVCLIIFSLLSSSWASHRMT